MGNQGNDAPIIREQKPGAAPLEHTGRPQRRQAPKAVTAQAIFAAEVSKAASGGPRADAAHGKAPEGATPRPEAEQVRKPANPSSEKYVRLTVHVDHGKMSITDAHIVEGPLTVEQTVAHGLAYEVRVGGQRLGLGSVPNANVRRAFANIGTPEPREHVAELKVFDFPVRLRSEDFSHAKLSQLELVLYNIDSAENASVTAEPLQKQPTLRVREIGKTTGIRAEELPERVRATLGQ